MFFCQLLTSSEILDRPLPPPDPELVRPVRLPAVPEAGSPFLAGVNQEVAASVIPVHKPATTTKAVGNLLVLRAMQFVALNEREWLECETPQQIPQVRSEVRIPLGLDGVLLHAFDVVCASCAGLAKEKKLLGSVPISRTEDWRYPVLLTNRLASFDSLCHPLLTPRISTCFGLLTQFSYFW